MTKTWLVFRDKMFFREIEAPSKREALRAAKEQYGGKLRVIEKDRSFV
jgi:hypothetical protein